MFIFATTIALIVGVAHMGFEQGQANPEANGFLNSKSQVQEDEVWLGDL